VVSLGDVIGKVPVRIPQKLFCPFILVNPFSLGKISFVGEKGGHVATVGQEVLLAAVVGKVGGSNPIEDVFFIWNDDCSCESIFIDED
jgi:hypothetical protein